MSCLCDQHHCPTPIAIAAGLALLPRAPGTFADWRSSLLFAVGRESELDGWRAREQGDLGLMLVEMGAYVFDVASFYDQLIANESYLSTAGLDGAQRRHVGLLGYLPRPGIGSEAWLAAEADGTRMVNLPAGTAFRSGEFDGNPPQVFELETPAVIEPRVNRFEVQRVPATLLPSPLPSLTVEAASVRVRSGDIVVLDVADTLAVTRVTGRSRLQLRSRAAVTQLDFSAAVTPPAGASYADARLLTGGQSCGAWKLAPQTGEPAVIDGDEVSLDTRLNLHEGDVIAFEHGDSLAARRVESVTDQKYTFLLPQVSDITDESDAVVSHLISPAIPITVTRLKLDADLPATMSDVTRLVVHHAMVDAATPYAPLKDTLDLGDAVSVPALIDAPRNEITHLLLEDVHGDGAVATGVLDATAHTASLDSAPEWGLSLWAPVQMFGNVLPVSRGESVHGELLGSGDASLARQTFRLKKKHLTYLSAENAVGRRTTLQIHVGGVRWDEVETFYGASAEQMLYTVRHDEDGETDIHFGGAARLPSGAAVLADYRFGAGAARPPADSIKQLARPVAGLRKVRNVLPAYGGADAEAPQELAQRGPASALLLGRAISLVDFETAAAQQPGVRAARAAWHWDALGLGPAVRVYIIGDAQLAPSVLAALRALAEDGAPLSVQVATAQPAALEVDIEVDAAHVPEDVIAAVQAALFAPVVLPGSGGLLRGERLGPDGVVFHSVVVHVVLDVPGVAALNALTFDDTVFTEVGRSPAAGAYFDFEVRVNGQAAP